VARVGSDEFAVLASCQSLDSVFTVKPHEGSAAPGREELERRVAGWPGPSLALPWDLARRSSSRVAFGEPDSLPLLSGRLEERIDGDLVAGLPA
jgi:hypothetical protein